MFFKILNRIFIISNSVHTIIIYLFILTFKAVVLSVIILSQCIKAKVKGLNIICKFPIGSYIINFFTYSYCFKLNAHYKIFSTSIINRSNLIPFMTEYKSFYSVRFRIKYSFTFFIKRLNHFSVGIIKNPLIGSTFNYSAADRLCYITELRNEFFSIFIIKFHISFILTNHIQICFNIHIFIF